MVIQHSTIPKQFMHDPYKWIVADYAAQIALSPTAADMYMRLFRQSDSSEWILINHTPITWQPVVPNIGSGLVYIGAWDASTDTPNLITGTPVPPLASGSYYKVSVAGFVGGVYYEVGDWVISNGAAWEKISNAVASGAIASDNNSVAKRDANGTLNAKGFDLDDSTTQINHEAGRMRYNSDGEIVLGLDADFSHQIGQQNVLRTENATGADIPPMTVVELINGQMKPTPLASSALTGVVGVTITNIVDGDFGYCVTSGVVSGNTGSYTPGTLLYVSDTTAGAITATIPTDAGYKNPIGKVLSTNLIYLDVNFAEISVNLSQLDDVALTSLQDKQVLTYDSGSSKWVNKTLTDDDAMTVYHDIVASQALVAGNLVVWDGDTTTIAFDDYKAVTKFDGVSNDPQLILGIVVSDVASGAVGKAVSYGVITTDTTLFTSPKVYPDYLNAGDLTNNQPPEAKPQIPVAIVYTPTSATGKMFVNIQSQYTLEDVGGVKLTTPTNGQVLTFDVASGTWINKNVEIPEVGTITVKNTSATSISAGRVLMQTGSYIDNGSVVYNVAAYDGAAPVHSIVGISKGTMASGAVGVAITNGTVTGINTSAFSAGDMLYPNYVATDGSLVSTPPATRMAFPMAIVSSVNATDGSIGVRIPTVGTVDQLDGVTITSPVTGQALVYDTSTSTWKNGTAFSTSSYLDVINQTGTVIPVGAVLAYKGATTVSGKVYIKVAPYSFVSDKDERIVGMASTAIANNATGMAAVHGVVTGVTTTGLAVGDNLFPSTTVSGGVTNAPSADQSKYPIGVVVDASTFYVKFDGMLNITDLGNVNISTPIANDVLKFDGVNWTNSGMDVSSVVIDVYNASASAIPALTLVKVAGASTVGGVVYTKVAQYDSTNAATDEKLLFGLATTSIGASSLGKVIVHGLLTGVDTTTLPANAVLYASETVNGALTTVVPTKLSKTPVAYVPQASGLGRIFVKINNPHKIETLGNVTVSPTVANNHILKYDSTAGRWLNAGLSLSLFSDFNITSPASGQTLVYDGITSKWKNVVNNLDSLSDVVITTPVANKSVVKYNGTNWVNSTFGLADIADMKVTSPAAGDGLVYTVDAVTPANTGWKNVKLSDTYLPKAGGVMTGAITSIKESRVAITGAINLSLGNLFTLIGGGTKTLSITNHPNDPNVAVSFILEVTNGGSGTVNWFAGIKWAGGSAPLLTATGVDVIGFYSYNNTVWYGIVMGKDLK